MKKKDCTRRGLLGLLLALCMTLLLVTPALAGVSGATGGSGVTVKTTVVNEYTDIHDKKTFDLTGKINTLTGTAGYFSAESGSLTVEFPGLAPLVELSYYTVDNDTVVMTVTNYDDLPDGTYTCPQQEDKTMMTTTYDGASLDYTGTTYDPGTILGTGSPGKVTINEIRTDYYTRNHIWRGYTLTVTGNGNGSSSSSGGTSGGSLSGSTATGGYNSPKTFDAGLTLYAASAALSCTGLTVLRRRKR